MNDIDVTQLIQQMRALNAELQGTQQPAAGGEAVNFQEMFSKAINQVNSLQQQTGAMATAFEEGDPSISLSDVMVAAQKSSVAFQATVQVRNRLVSAYQDIMSMPI